MLTEEQKRQMVAQIRDYLGTFTHAEFARMMGISAQNAYVWLTRGSFNAELIAARYPEISGDWLLTGKGSMLKGNDAPPVNGYIIPQDTINKLEHLVDAIVNEQKLTAKAQAQTDRLIDLMHVIAKTVPTPTKENVK